MTVTFINVPKGMQPKSAADPHAPQNGVSAAKVVEEERVQEDGPLNLREGCAGAQMPARMELVRDRDVGVRIEQRSHQGVSAA